MKPFTLSLRTSQILAFVFVFATSLSLSAQNDPLTAALSSVHDANKMQLRVSSSPATRAKLDGLKLQVQAKKLSFQVAYNPAMDRTKKQLVGTNRPKTANSGAVKAQDDMNERIITKAAAEFQQDKVAVPDVAISTRSSMNKHRSLTLPANYFAGLSLLPEIKDQGSCGSCWAFAACGVFETTFRKFYGTSRVVDVSEQDLVDCGETGDHDDAGSCGGGYSDRAFDYIRTYGTTTETIKPYKGTEETCVEAAKNFRAYTWGQVYPDRFPTVEEVKKYVFTYGAVVTYMKAGIESFYAYKSGVYNDSPSDDPYDVDHAVIIVGWDELSKAWIVRNSWGKEWGYSGYSYISYEACNIGKWVYWVYPKYTNKKRTVSGASPSGQAQAQAEEPVEVSPIMRASRN